MYLCLLILSNWTRFTYNSNGSMPPRSERKTQEERIGSRLRNIQCSQQLSTQVWQMYLLLFKVTISMKTNVTYRPRSSSDHFSGKFIAKWYLSKKYGQTFFLIIEKPYPTKEGRRTTDRLQCACCKNMPDSRYYCVRLGRQLFIGWFWHHTNNYWSLIEWTKRNSIEVVGKTRTKSSFLTSRGANYPSFEFCNVFLAK